MKELGRKVKWTVGVTINSKIPYFKDSLKMISNKDLEVKFLVKAINIMVNTLLTNFMVKENIFGQMVHITLEILERDLDMILEDGFLRVKNRKYMKVFIQKTKSKEVESMCGIMDVCMKVTLTMT